jgi:hypothetical protein
MIVFRFVKSGKSGAARADLRLDEPEIRIGRSRACGLKLPHAGVRFEHAVMRFADGSLVLTALPGATLGAPGKTVPTARLARLGDTAQIGPYRLTLAAISPAGDPTVEILQEGPAEEGEEALTRRHFAAFGSVLPNVRLWGFTLACALVLLFFISPLVSHPGVGSLHTDTVSGRNGPPSLLQSVAFNVTGLWNVGRISAVHSSFGANCANCHQVPFIPTRSSACLSCHQTIGQHADPHLAPAADISQQRCETCHLEHKGIEMAIRDRQSDCAACHADIRAWAPNTMEQNASDFGRQHPQFKASLIDDAVLHTTRKFVIGDTKAPDNSNLKFTHATHLKLADLVSKIGPGKAGAETCALCHELAPGGVSFKPVPFESACSACHTLQFEPDFPQWRLPHGHPEEVESRVAGFYARAVLEGKTFFTPPLDPFRKPGAPPPAPPPTGVALVDSMTAQAMMSSIARSSCGECHLVLPPKQGQPATAWKIAPVFVPDRYMPSTLFNHDQHATSTCESCHASRTSNGGPTEVLPGIETCRNCHTGESGGAQRIASTCISCHRFHDDSMPIMKQAAAAPKTAGGGSQFSQAAPEAAPQNFALGADRDFAQRHGLQDDKGRN